MNVRFHIRELRERNGITQAELATALGLKSSSSITMWENGSRKPSSAMLPLLAEALDCTIDELFDRGKSSA